MFGTSALSYFVIPGLQVWEFLQSCFAVLQSKVGHDVEVDIGQGQIVPVQIIAAIVFSVNLKVGQLVLESFLSLFVLLISGVVLSEEYLANLMDEVELCCNFSEASLLEASVDVLHRSALRIRGEEGVR